MRTIITVAVTLCAASVLGCAAQKPDSLTRVEHNLHTAKLNDFVVKNAPLKLREAERTVALANNTWENKRNEKQTNLLALQAEEQITGARAHAEREAVAALKKDVNHTQQLLEKESEITQAKQKSESLYIAASHYKDKAESVETEKRALMNELQAKETKEGLKITMGADVLFEVDRAELKSGGERDLKPLARYLKENSELEVVIEGHTDSLGESQYNRQLSVKRAEAVKRYLVQKGINQNQVKTKGMGEGYPIASNDSNAGRLQNRRVEIIVSEG